MVAHKEKGLRAGTENVAAIVAMAVALKENVSKLEHNIRHLKFLENMLLERLSENGVTFQRNGAVDHILSNISMSFPNADGEAILHRLDFRVYVSRLDLRTTFKNTQISHVLKAIGLDEPLATGTIRISLGKDNTEDDITRTQLMH